MQGTDKNRSLFLKGFNLSRQGNYEDPTYLGFKIIFDFGGLPIDEYGMAPSPLFRDDNYSAENSTSLGTNPFGQEQYNLAGNTQIAYYSAQKYLEEREHNFDQSNPLSKIDLFGLNVKSDFLDSINKGGKRSDMLRQFKILLQDVNKNSPWFFQSIEGLDELISVNRVDYNASSTESFSPQRTQDNTLKINCLESLNLRISALAELYRQATFDAEYMRELVPKNLRYFKMFILVSEIRNFNKTARLSGSAAAVQAVTDLSSLLGSNMNPGTSNAIDKVIGGVNKVFPGGSSPGGGLNSFVGNLAQQKGATTAFDVARAAGEQSGIKPVTIIECSQCEFDFDKSYPFKSTLHNGSGSAEAETQSFNIHVGRVKVKNQYPNIRLDGLPLVLSDGWDSFRSSVQKSPRDVNDLLSQGQDLLTNMVSNHVGDMITEGVANLTSKITGQPINTFDGVYNFSTAQDSLAPENIFYGNKNPQDSGFGGPPDRIYKDPEGDAYPDVPGKDLGSPDRVYKKPVGDAYSEVPGKDLGSPGRIYKKPVGDVYPDVPGTDLGSPDRLYQKPTGDVYPDVPGTDLGSPDRVYQKPTGDVYPDVPGTDLGSPARVYRKPTGDVYPDVPGKDLGGNSREYKGVSDDLYRNVPGKDLGSPERSYKGPSDDLYSGVPGKDLGSPERKYEKIKEDEYSGDLGNLNTGRGESGRETISDKVYKTSELPKSEGTRFKAPPKKVYEEPKKVIRNRGNIADAYPPTNGDFISKPKLDLGNQKPEDKYNVSLGDFNPDPNKFD